MSLNKVTYACIWLRINAVRRISLQGNCNILFAQYRGKVFLTPSHSQRISKYWEQWSNAKMDLVQYFHLSSDNTDLNHKSTYLDGGTIKIRLNSHVTMDPVIQHTRAKTKKPAKIVSNGGPLGAPSPVFATFDFSVRASPSDGVAFNVNTVTTLRLSWNFKTFLNLNERNNTRLRTIYHLRV